MRILNFTKEMSEIREIKAYQELSNAVISFAIKDLRVGNLREQESAKHFFEYGAFEIWADLTGTEYASIMDKYKEIKSGIPQPEILLSKSSQIVIVEKVSEKPDSGYTVSEVIKKYGIPRKQLQYYGYRKPLPNIVKYNNIYYFQKDDIEQMIEYEKLRKGSKYYVK